MTSRAAVGCAALFFGWDHIKDFSALDTEPLKKLARITASTTVNNLWDPNKPQTE
jgi:hypothetical protein